VEWDEAIEKSNPHTQTRRDGAPKFILELSVWATRQKLVPRTHFSEYLHEQIPRANRPQQRPTLVTTEGNKMQVAPADIAAWFLT